MATATVTISNVHLEGANTVAPGSVVGSDPWNDASAGTYSENTTSRIGLGTPDEVEVAVADLSLPGLDVATLNSVTLDADFTATNAGDAGTGHQVNVTLRHPTLGDMTNFTGATSALSGDTLETITTSTTTMGSDPADLTTFLLPALTGGSVRVSRFGNADEGFPYDLTIRTHRLVLTIDYEPAGEPPPVFVTDTATRMWPRKDNLGPMASAPRHVSEWPPERLIRY